MSFNILNTLDISGAPEASSVLSEVGRLETVEPERDLVLSKLSEVHVYISNCKVRVDKEFLDRAPNLKLIGSPSTGTDHLDLQAIEARGIELFHIAKEYELLNSFTATSELAFTLLLALNRRLLPAQKCASEGVWAREYFSGFQLLGKTLGIIGLGRLGKISARIGRGFGMRVLACDVEEKSAPGVEVVDIDTLLEQADVVSVHVHLTPETENLIGAESFRRMKKNAIFLNTSRGRIVNETALLNALNSGEIAGAGLDVVDGEWLDENQLRDHPLIAYSRENENLIVVPHIGGSTTESIYGARVFMAKKIANFLSDGAI
ncbi:MAG: NAD(P)-dependent oxidoreductase [Rhizobiaceae bacterium]